jgi:NADPH:quinone reductase-like Zn-dependent oxidoreductase
MAIPETMQAVILDQYGGPLAVRQIPTPQPGPGEVLVRMAAAPINPSDLGFIRGGYRSQKPVPVVPGFEGSGTVVAGGPGMLPRLWQGRRVACAASSRHGGSWAEYMVTSAKLCVPLNASISLELGAMMLVNPLTVLAFFELARKAGHAALVNTAAASNLGRMVLRMGKSHSLPVIHVVRRVEQVELLRSLGGELVLNSSEPGFEPQLAELARQLNATLLLDAIGGEMTGKLLAAGPPGCTVLAYSLLSLKEACLDPRLLFNENKTIAGFYLPTWQSRQSLLQTLLNIRKVQRMLLGELKPTVQSRLPLSQAAQGLDQYTSQMTAGKVLLVADKKAVELV